VGGLFIEADNAVKDYNNNHTIYFTLGNRNEYTVNLGSGTMTLNSASSMTMAATSGSNSASLRLNSLSTGSYSKSDFDLSNCSFRYNGSNKTILDISAEVTASNGVYTMVATIRDNSQNVYFVTLTAPIKYYVAFNGNGSTGGTMTDQVFTYGVPQNLNPNAFTGPAATITYNYHGATSGNGTPSVTVNNPFGGWEDSVNDELHDDEEEVSYSVANGATVTMTAQWNAFPGVTLPTPARTGYTFNGWYTEETGGTKKGNGGANFVPAGSITLHAQWTASNYTITYNAGANGTGAAIANGSKTPGVVFTLSSSTFTRTGYTQTGWSLTDGGAKAYELGGTYSTDANLDLYPFWTANTYTVSFDAGEGSGTMTNQTLTYGVADYLKANTLTGPAATATFDYNGATGNIGVSSMTVNATFTEWSDGNTHTYADQAEVLNLTSTNGGNVTLTAQWDFDYEHSTIYLPSAPTRTGYTFDKWQQIDGMGIIEYDAEEDFDLTEDATLIASWNAITYNLTYEGLNGATNSNPATYTVETATFALANPGTRDGYTFTGWTCGGSPITQITLGSTGDKTITANWQLDLSGTIQILDNGDAAYYTDIETTYGGQTANYQLMRTFFGGMWNTVCLPFDLTLAGSPFASANVVRYVNATGDANDGMYLNFEDDVTEMTAGTPYLMRPAADIENPTFSGVTLVSDFTGGTVDGDDIDFIGTLQPTLLAASENNMFVGQNNTLYYPSAAGNLKAFRAYFRVNGSAGVHPRARIVIRQTPTGLQTADFDGQETVRKYMENGILIIERNGVKYDAQGAKVED